MRRHVFGDIGSRKGRVGNKNVGEAAKATQKQHTDGRQTSRKKRLVWESQGGKQEPEEFDAAILNLRRRLVHPVLCNTVPYKRQSHQHPKQCKTHYLCTDYANKLYVEQVLHSWRSELAFVIDSLVVIVRSNICRVSEISGARTTDEAKEVVRAKMIEHILKSRSVVASPLST